MLGAKVEFGTAVRTSLGFAVEGKACAWAPTATRSASEARDMKRCLGT
jgi:hypothetical protein